MQRMKSLHKQEFGGAVTDLDHHLSATDIVYKSPPFTKDLVDAVKCTPMGFQYHRGGSKKMGEGTNATSWGEYKCLQPILEGKKISRILEFGPGLGRSVVFFSKKFGWEDKEYHLYDGNGSTTKYTMVGPRFDDSFCGNLKMLEKILKFNGLSNFEIFDSKVNFDPKSLPGEYDLIYSFYSIGFHWDLNYFIDDILFLLKKGGIGAFLIGVNKSGLGISQPLQQKLKNQNAKVVVYTPAWGPKENYMLIVEKTT